MSEQLYKLTGNGDALFKDRGSKFYAYAFPVQEKEEVNAHLQALKKQYYDARHHCYAYRLGDDGTLEFSTDDREPSNSAGPPILAAIKSADLTHALVVVVRYFGGTKLGIRGLIEAYRTAAEMALAACSREAIIPQVCFELEYAYENTSDIKRILHPFELKELQASYTDRCLQQFAIHEDHFESLQGKLTAEGFKLKVLDDE